MWYIVCFHESVQTEEKLYQIGEVIRVNQEDMFKWVEKSHSDKIKICIYTCTMVCDLS